MDASVKRILAAVVLVAFVSGCAGYRPASMAVDEAADAGAAVHEVVEAGQKVRLTLVSGEIIEGEVAAVTEDGLTVGRSGNYGYTERTVAAGEISLLEIQSLSTGSKIALYTAAGVFVVGALAVGLFVDGMAGLGGSQ